MTATELLFLDDAYATTMDATVLEVREDGAVALDKTVFYATGGGQPHDTGTLSWADGTALAVTEVRKQGDLVWHSLAAAPNASGAANTAVLPAGASVVGASVVGASPAGASPVGASVVGNIDWERRHQLMRTHTSLHILCGVIWNEWGVYVTGGNMEPLAARMDFEFGQLPENFAAHVTQLVNNEIAADRPIEVSYLDRETALVDEELIRTKVNMVPESVKMFRIVDIVGLDKQADGGTHVRSTSEVGTFEITKTESKGKGNKRVRMVLRD